LAKGGVATGARILSLDDNGQAEWENVRLEIDLQQVEGGFWVPKEVRQVWPNDNDMAIATFEAVKVNPEVSSDDFVLDFPEGVRVDDHIDSVSYVVGRELDRESMTREFMRRHRIDSQQPPA
jgi:hypothetical protein